MEEISVVGVAEGPLHSRWHQAAGGGEIQVEANATSPSSRSEERLRVAVCARAL